MKRNIYLVLSIAIFLLTTACGANIEQDITATEVKTPAISVSKKVLRHNEGLPGTCDPAGATDNTAAIIYVNVYDSLIFPNEKGEPEPWLAESWEISDDGLTYTFHLRKGVKFHHGGELKASDVIYSIERLITIGQGYGYLFTDVYESAEALNDNTVVFHLKHAFGPFLSALCRLYIVSEEEVTSHYDMSTNTYGEKGDYGTGYLLEADAGTGPYTIVSYSQLDSMVADKFDDFWNGWDADSPEQIEIIFTTEVSTIRTLMGNGELHISDPFESKETLDVLSSLNGVEIVNYLDGLSQYLTFNTAIEPTDDIYYRKALASLVDYTTVASFFAGGKVATGLISSTLPGVKASPDFAKYQEFNLEKAAELFAQSKYADQLANYRLVYTVHNEDVALEKLGLMLKEALSQFGIEMEINVVPWLTFTDSVASIDTTPNITSFSNGAAYWDAGSLIEGLFSSKTSGTWENPMWLQDVELDKMISEGLSITDETQRYEKYNEILKYIMSLCPMVCIADINRQVAYNEDYVTWPTAEQTFDTSVYSAPTGYAFYFHDCKLADH